MPTTPYAVSSDLVSAWPAKSLAVAQFVDGYKTDLAMVQNAQTGTTYTLALTDFTKLVTLNNASPVSVTLPLESTVAWETGTQLRLLNIGAGTVTVAGAVGVTINGTPLTLAQYKAAILTKTGTNTWVFLPFSGGSAPAVISSTTGSPTITTDAGASVYKYTGDGTLVVGTAGIVRILVQSGGGGGGKTYAGGGGAGSFEELASVFLAAGTYDVKVGAGGAGGTANVGTVGGASTFGFIPTAGGGGGGGYPTAPTTGGSGGGGCSGAAGAFNTGAATTATILGGPVGFAGGNAASAGPNYGGGGGGGAGSVGAAGTTTVGGAGGSGVNSDISVLNTNVGYAGGGGGGSNGGTAGTATSGGGAGSNTSSAAGSNGTQYLGGGGGGGGATSTSTFSNGGNGGSGSVLVRVG